MGIFLQLGGNINVTVKWVNRVVVSTLRDAPISYITN